MPTRHKNGRVRVTSTPQRGDEGRRSPIAPAIRAPSAVTEGELCFLYTLEFGEWLAAKANEHAEPSPETRRARRAATKRKGRVAAKLSALVGPDEAKARIAALSADGGLLARAAAEASPHLREHAIRAVVSGVAIAREHAVQSTAAIMMLGRAQRWEAFTNAILDAVLRKGVSERLLKLAAACGAQARLDLLGALQLARQEQQGGGSPAIDMVARLAEIRAREAAAIPVVAMDDADDVNESNGGGTHVDG